MVDQFLAHGSESSRRTFSVYDASKRLVDVIVSAGLLIAFLPILVLVAIWVKLDSKGPVFFRQSRVGKSGVVFQIIKFRTMVVNAERLGPQVTSRNDPRMTRSGTLLRAWKLDELPQFLNVLYGNMSLVGPRPQVAKYVDLFPGRQRAKILSVKPGITGPTAIKFRHEEEMLQNRENREQFYIDVLLPIKCDLDETYVDSRSMTLDLRVLFQTASMLVHGVVNRIRRIPIGDTIEYPIPESSLHPEKFQSAAVDLERASARSRRDEDDDSLEASLL
jgi:lipopolysaccharide/colanic/teichoic acid biosynthesis glycosyltransferase